MIKKLTPEQEAKIPLYVKKWTDIGLNTEPFTQSEAEAIIWPFQTEILKQKRTPVFIFDNPIKAWCGVLVLNELFKNGNQVETQVNDQVETQVWCHVLEQVRKQVKSQVGEQVWNQVMSQVRNHVMDQVEGQVRDQVWDKVREQVRKQVKSQVGDQVMTQVSAEARDQVSNRVSAQIMTLVWGQVMKQARDQVVNQVDTQVRDRVRTQVWDQVWNQVGNQVGNQIDNQVMAQVKDFVWPYQDGSFFSHVFSFYDFFIQEGIVTIEKELQDKFTTWSATSKLGLIYPFEDFCVVCQKPSKILLNENGLHSETEQALQYKDWGFWSLNGVVVPQWLAETPSSQLKPDDYFKLDNADQKAEFIRKIGVERMLDKGKLVDTYRNYDDIWWSRSEYELWDMSDIFPNSEYQPCLKMLNQTTGVWHCEWVSPNCRTLRDAIRERFGGRDFNLIGIA